MLNQIFKNGKRRQKEKLSNQRVMGRVYPTIPKRDETGKDSCRRPEKIIDVKQSGLSVATGIANVEIMKESLHPILGVFPFSG